MPTLTDPLPQTLFGSADVAVQEVDWARRDLDGCCFLDLARGYLHGSDVLLGELVEALPLAPHRRLMYGEFVDEPRLSCAAPLSLPIMSAIADDLSARQRQRFVSCWVNYYRDGRDSVAWHGDRLSPAGAPAAGRHRLARRHSPFCAAPERRRSLIALHAAFGRCVGDGGGRCQQHFEHCVPKMTYAAPRISVRFRTSMAG